MSRIPNITFLSNFNPFPFTIINQRKETTQEIASLILPINQSFFPGIAETKGK